jgi:hypothetical protein
MIKTFTGQPRYCVKRLRDLHGQGYKIIRSHKHPDGSETYVMEYVGRNKT